MGTILDLKGADFAQVAYVKNCEDQHETLLDNRKDQYGRKYQLELKDWQHIQFYCEERLIFFLKEFFSQLDFKRGVIHSEGSRIDKFKKNFFPLKVDIIICNKKKNTPKTGTKPQKVKLKDVLGVIEVRRWLYPKDFMIGSGVQERLKDLRWLTNKPVLLVGVRIHDDSIVWTGKKDIFVMDGYYGGKYPRQRTWWHKDNLQKKHNKSLGEFKRLIKRIKGISKNEH